VGKKFLLEITEATKIFVAVPREQDLEDWVISLQVTGTDKSYPIASQLHILADFTVGEREV
jgi:hypothetical protein